MDFVEGITLSFCLICLSIYLVFRHWRVTGNSLPPPGPWPLPVVGNIHQLLIIGTQPHRSLAKLSEKHGPVMSLKLGANKVVVVSSQSGARSALEKNDKALSNKVIPNVMTVGDHYNHSMILLPITEEKWKKLRRLSTLNIFSPQKLNATQPLRREKVDDLLSYLRRSSIQGQAVDITKASFTTILNMMSNTLFSIDLGHYNNNYDVDDQGRSSVPDDNNSKSLCHHLELKELIWGLMKEAGSPNISDFFPALRFLDLQGIHRRATSYYAKLVAVFNGIIAEKKKNKKNRVAQCEDILDSLLHLKARGEIDHNGLICILVDLLVAGVDTSHGTLEWAMAELTKNPEKMERAKAELEKVIGKGVKVEEEDISNLPYLEAIIKETLRLHPVVPLLLPRKAESHGVNLCGFELPQNTQILVNVWAIGRDPNMWTDPTRFEPERFLGLEVDFKGNDFEMIPFGAGRRICPGMPLALRTMPLTLASIIHSFDWEAPESIDMTEKFGLTLQKAMPLYIKPVSKLS